MAGHGGPLADYGLQWPASVYCSHPFQHDLTCAVQESQYLLRNKIGRAGGAGPFHSEFRVYTILTSLIHLPRNKIGRAGPFHSAFRDDMS